MQIALDGSDLAAERVEGPSVYAGELLQRLSRLLSDRGHSVTTYLPDIPRGATVTGETRVIPGSPFWTQRFLSAALRRDRPGVLFMPIQMLPLFRPQGMKTVAVVHDLEFLHYPETYTLANRVLLHVFTRHAVRNATQLIAVSQYTKDDVVRTYGRSADDIAVVHHGVNHARFTSEPGEMDKETLESLRIPQKYLLFVGALQPRKNIAGLVKAMEIAGASVPSLVLVAGGGWKEAGLRERIENSSAKERLHLLRRVSLQELAVLYRHALAFVLPSFSEGFGMPVLEAMASGAPVIVSRTSSLPEIAGDAGLFVDPYQPRTIAEALVKMSQDARLRDDLRAKGLARARQFSWERAAEQTAAVIERAGRKQS